MAFFISYPLSAIGHDIRKLLTAIFLSYAIESAKNKCVYWICILLISCSITMYLIIAKNDNSFWYKSVVSSFDIWEIHEVNL
jgi:hypothetical protein